MPAPKVTSDYIDIKNIRQNSIITPPKNEEIKEKPIDKVIQFEDVEVENENLSIDTDNNNIDEEITEEIVKVKPKGLFKNTTSEKTPEKSTSNYWKLGIIGAIFLGVFLPK